VSKIQPCELHESNIIAQAGSLVKLEEVAFEEIVGVEV
jgi:hypothetical protein